MRTAAAVAITALGLSTASAKAPLSSKFKQGSQSAFVHLFEWSWADVAQECEDFLGPKGYAAVQISPPMEHIKGDSWWTRYQPVTYKLVSRSGDEKAFVDMVQRCSAVGVDIYADAVFNHVAGGSGVGVAGSKYADRSTPDYTQQDFHHSPYDMSTNCGVTNYQDKFNVQDCDLVGLPDLCTGCPKVQKTVAAYLDKMLKIGVAGFRIDAAKHQDPKELETLLSQVDGGIPYTFQEVIGSAGEAVSPDWYSSIGQVTEFQYSRSLAPNIIDQGKMGYLEGFGERWGFMSRDSAVVFIDNHDTQRGEAQLTYKKGQLYNLANIFMLAHPYGYPKVMSSYYWDNHDAGPPSTPVHNQVTNDVNVNCGNGKPWVCEHRRPEIANMIKWRKAAGGHDLSEFSTCDGGDCISFCRGAGACVALNRRESNWQVRIKTTLPPGKYRDVLRNIDISKCPEVTVDHDGYVELNVPAMSGSALHIELDESNVATKEVVV